MGAMQPWHLLVLLFIVALVASVVLLVVLLLARSSVRPSSASTTPSAPRPAQPTLTELAALHARGQLTDEEFTAAKRKALDL
ncbi:hypothetical protein GCM10027059_24580 [Myceligenerans halotolerans]